MGPFCSLIRVLLLTAARVGRGVEKRPLQPPETFISSALQTCWSFLLQHNPSPPNSIPLWAEDSFSPSPISKLCIWLFLSAFITRVRRLQTHIDPIACVSCCDSSLWRQKSWSWEGIPPSEQANTSTPTSLFLSKTRQVHPCMPLYCTAASLQVHSPATTALHRARSQVFQHWGTSPPHPRGGATRSGDEGRHMKETTTSLVFNLPILQSPGLTGRRLSGSLSSQPDNNTDIISPPIFSGRLSGTNMCYQE